MKNEEKKGKSLNYLPHIGAVIGSVLYFAVSISWLLSQKTELLPAIFITLGSFSILTILIITLAPIIRKKINGQESLSEESETETDEEETTESFRHEAWIDGLKHDARKVRMRLLKMGIGICILATLYFLGMNAFFDLSFEEIFLFSVPVLIVLWFLQILYLPRWLTYVSFFVFSALRFGIQMVAHVPHDTREQHPQIFYEGLIRTSVASWVTEHYFFGQNLPGVTGDLSNATGVACLMVGRFGMVVYDCSKEDKDYYANIGNILISEPESNMFNPQATALVESVLRNPDQRTNVAVILGMAAIDAYRLIRRNEQIFGEVIPEFLHLDEYSGDNLTTLWEKLNSKIVSLENMDEADKQARPPFSFAISNPFYGATVPEGDQTYQQIDAQVNNNS